MAISTRALDLLLLLRGSEPEGLGRAEQVSYQIETAILMGILTEGDRLPTESVLAGELGISPITLRQSLAALGPRASSKPAAAAAAEALSAAK
jgi:DNA-binding transcriptional MocR family regulator